MGTQHIKNTDFRYKDKMPHKVNDPYVWDESFQVNYVRLDDEHKVLFDAMQKLGENPSDVDLLNYNRDVYRDHFDYEEKQFMACGEPCAADEHKKKHDVFFKTLTWVTTPVSQEYVQYAKNWLAQHIKNTDFKYRYKLPTQHTVPEPYIWNNELKFLTKDWMMSTRYFLMPCCKWRIILETKDLKTPSMSSLEIISSMKRNNSVIHL